MPWPLIFAVTAWNAVLSALGPLPPTSSSLSMVCSFIEVPSTGLITRYVQRLPTAIGRNGPWHSSSPSPAPPSCASPASRPPLPPPSCTLPASCSLPASRAPPLPPVLPLPPPPALGVASSPSSGSFDPHPYSITQHKPITKPTRITPPPSSELVRSPSDLCREPTNATRRSRLCNVTRTPRIGHMTTQCETRQQRGESAQPGARARNRSGRNEQKFRLLAAAQVLLEQVLEL